MNTLIFDGNSLYARSWYAALGKDGVPSADNIDQAVEISLYLVFSLMDPHGDRIGKKIDKTLFCWDDQAKRDKERHPKPNEFYDSLKIVKQKLTQLIGTAHARVPGYEADDMVATAAYAQPETDQVYVVSGDKDIQQVQGGNVHYYCLNTKAVLSRTSILNRWKVKRPSQIAIALAILGDKGDKIAGVRGWGPAKVEKVFKAVTPEMKFDEALSAVAQQIPPELTSEFFESLDLTILSPSVPDVPEPKPVALIDIKEARRICYGKALEAYRRLQSRDMDEGDDEMAEALKNREWEP